MKRTQPSSRDVHDLILFLKVEPHDPEHSGFNSHSQKSIGWKRQGLMALTCPLFKRITSDIKADGKKRINSQWVLYLFFFPVPLVS